MSSLSNSRHARRTGQPIKAMKPGKAIQCAKKIWDGDWDCSDRVKFIDAVSDIIRQFYPEETPDSVKITLEKPQPDPTKSEGSDLSFID